MSEVNNKTLLVSDYDQTFNNNANANTQNKIKIDEFRKKGGLFAFATGRSFQSIARVINKYDIEYDYLICHHGAVVLDNKRNLLMTALLDNWLHGKIQEIANQFKYTETYRYTPLEDRVGTNRHHVVKLYYKYSSESEAFSISNKINTALSEFAIAYPVSEYAEMNAVEVINSSVDKSVAIDYLANMLSLSKIYTIGDSYNDINMITKFNGYCVNNATSEIKEQCPKRCSSVSELVDRILEGTI